MDLMFDNGKSEMNGISMIPSQAGHFNAIRSTALQLVQRSFFWPIFRNIVSFPAWPQLGQIRFTLNDLLTE
jgi:hypothetical protein